jgi:NADH-quinone oxidoreductase subunit L
MALPLILLAIGSILRRLCRRAARAQRQQPHRVVPRACLRGALGEAHGDAAAVAEAQTARPAAVGHAAEETHADAGTELTLMALSSGIALAGIGIAWYFWVRNRSAADRMAQSFGGVYRLLLDKYRIDELYDTVFVQPIKLLSTVGLWRGVDAGLIDGAVNGVGAMISGSSSVLRRMQTGSVRTYAFGLFAGAVAILGYYLLR